MSITVITGPPGAGKTTFAALIARSMQRAVVLPTDYWYHWIVAGYVAPWKPEADAQNATVIEAVGSSAARFAAGGYQVVVDGIVGPWFLDRFLAAAGHPPGGVRYVVLRPARDVASARSIGRTGELDLTDPAAIAAMYDVFGDLGPYERHVIDSSDQHPAETLRVVLGRLESGAFTVPLHRP